MISALSGNGFHAEAVVLFRKMLLQGVAPNKVTLHTILSVLGRAGTLPDVQFVHFLCCRLDCFKELAPSLISVYGRLDKTKLATEVFSEADKSDVVLWNCFLATCTEPVHQFRKMLLEGLSADKVTSINLLQSSAILKPEELLQVVQPLILELGLEDDAIIATGMIKAYGRCKKTDRAFQVFNRMRILEQDDSVTWTSMLSAHADNGEHEKAVALLRKMQLEGVKPDKLALVKAINVCAGCGSLQQGTSVQAIVEVAGYTLDTGVGSALMSFYGSLGKLDIARDIFERLHHRDVCSWTALISACCEAGHHDAAVGAFRKMQQSGILPDTVSILAVLKNSPSLADVAELGLSLDGLNDKSRTLISTEVLSLYGRHGSLDNARLLFEQMVEKDSVAWNAIIAAYAQHGHTSKAMEIFQAMQVEGVEADSGTFASITSACSHSGMLPQGCSYFSAMLQEFGVVRVDQNYASVVDLFCRAGELGDAERAAVASSSSMPWKTMLGSCRYYKDVKRGVSAASEVLNQDPLNAEAYMSLSTLLCLA